MTLNSINVLVSQRNWAWPEAVRSIFRPRGINSLLAENTNDVLSIIRRRHIHTAIVDMSSDSLNGLSTIRIIRGHYPSLPCILLSNAAEKDVLSKALQLDVFSVIAKPVNMNLLQEQLNKIFLKKYGSSVFS